MANDEQGNNNTNGVSIPEYQLVVHLWVTKRVDDGLYQVIFDLTHQYRYAMHTAGARPKPAVQCT